MYDDFFIGPLSHAIDIDPTTNLLLKYNGNASIIIYTYYYFG